jgi:capsular exopolysaccharide synthesis family protein
MASNTLTNTLSKVPNAEILEAMPWASNGPSTYARPEFVANEGIPWRQVLRVLRKHWKIPVAFALALEIGLAFLVFSLENTYQGRATLEVEPPGTGPVAPGGASTAATPTQQSYLETQIEILQGDSLALGVIKELKLADNPVFSKQSWIEKLPAQVIGLLRPARDGDNTAQTDQLLQTYRGHMTVSQVRNSRLVELRYDSYDPQLSAQIVSAVVRQYMEMTHRSKYEATLRAAQSLSPELSELKRAAEEANQTLLQFQRSHTGVELGSAGVPGPNGATSAAMGNPVSVRVADLNQQLTEAIGARLEQESYMKLLSDGNNDSLPQMKDDQIIKDLTTRVAETRGQLAQALGVYGGSNPQVRKLQLQVEELTSQLEAERNRIANRVRASYSSALRREELIQRELRDLKGSLDTSNANVVQYDSLKREADANSNLYVALSSRIKELAVSGSLNANNIRLVDEARVPESPSGPRRMRILAFGLVFGLFSGIALAFVAEGMDDTISSLDDLRGWSKLPALALVPRISAGRPHRALFSAGKLPLTLPSASVIRAKGVKVFGETPNSPETESIRNLGTSIRLTFLPGERRVKTVLITSAFPGEGKTTVAVNLAVALAKQGKTCLVDADLRHPAITSSFGLSGQPGLQDLLVKTRRAQEVCTQVPGALSLAVLGAGAKRSDTLEMLMSQRMRDIVDDLRSSFDYIVIDSPPIIPFSDARWLSTVSDGSVLVARSSATTRRAMMWGMEILEDLRAPVLGIVLNGVDLQSEYYAYGADRYSHP